MYSLVTIQLYNHHLDKLQSFWCYHMFLNHFLSTDQRNFFDWSQHYNLLSPLLKDNISCHFLDHFYLWIIKQKIYLFLQNLYQLQNLNICFAFDLFFLDWYLVQLVVLLKPDFNCLSNFKLSLVDKVTTGT